MKTIPDGGGAPTVQARVMTAILLAAAGIAALYGLTAWATSPAVAAALMVLALLLVAGLVLFLPVGTAALAARPAPAADPAAARALFAETLARAEEPLNPDCTARLFLHEGVTETAVVLFHGVSSCPHAFVDFAPLLHRRGHNVVLVRMPFNGFADRATTALGRLRAEDLVEMADRGIDVARGLGRRVVAVGISAGGTAAAFAAQHRADLDRVVLLAPFFGLGRNGALVQKALMRLLLAAPDIAMWKDPKLKDRYVGMRHAYQRQSSRATGEIMRLGFATIRAARRRAPAAGSAAIVTNAGDGAVDNRVTDLLAGLWTAHGMALAEHVFPAEAGLGHELIDPKEPGADPAVTYPVILSLIEAAPATAAA